MIWKDLGISGGTALLVLIALYFVIKWAVKNGIKQAFFDITGKDAPGKAALLEQMSRICPQETKSPDKPEK